MSGPGGGGGAAEEEGGGGGTRSPRSRSPVMGVAGLMRDQQQKTQQGSALDDDGRRGSGPGGPGTGILRLDPAKPRRSSAASVEFRNDKEDPSSPCPSDRLSVTWADGERSVSSDVGSLVPKLSPDHQSITTLIPACGSLLEEPPDDEFSVSVSAILKRSNSKSSRRSTKKRKKLRRTSTVTTSSGETVVEVDGSSSAEDAEELLRIHKEVLAGVSQQPWSIDRKLRLVRNSREYIKRHEGEMEQRLAQSTSTKDVLLRYFIMFRRLVRSGIQALYQWIMGVELWQKRIKTIESHFGSAVASYFTFLRWVLGLNVALTALLAAFVIIPEFLAADRTSAGERKHLLESDLISAYDFKVMWDFEGIMRYSPIFYGYYSKTPKTNAGYRLPLAYFLASLAVYAYSFVAILRKMAANSRMSKLSEDEEYTFTWRLLAGWDFTIGNLEAAHNKVAAINTGFRESLLEAKESEKEEKSWKLQARRFLAHFIVLLLIVASAYAVVLLVQRSAGVDDNSSWYRQNELTIVLTLISIIYPNLFDLVGLLELRHPRNQLQWQLSRIMALNLLNLYTLIFALFNKVGDMTSDLCVLKDNLTMTHGGDMNMGTTITLSFPNDTDSLWETFNNTGYSPSPGMANSSLYAFENIFMSDLGNDSLVESNNTFWDAVNASWSGYLTSPSLAFPSASPDPPTWTRSGGLQSDTLEFVTAMGTTLFMTMNFTGLPQGAPDSITTDACRRVPVPCPSTPPMTFSLDNFTDVYQSNNTFKYENISSDANYTDNITPLIYDNAGMDVNISLDYNLAPNTLDGYNYDITYNYDYIDDNLTSPSAANKMTERFPSPLNEPADGRNETLPPTMEVLYPLYTTTMIGTSESLPPTLSSTAMRPWTVAANKTQDESHRNAIPVLPFLPGRFGPLLDEESFNLDNNYDDRNLKDNEISGTGDGETNAITKREVSVEPKNGDHIDEPFLKRSRRVASFDDYGGLGVNIPLPPSFDLGNEAIKEKEIMAEYSTLETIVEETNASALLLNDSITFDDNVTDVINKSQGDDKDKKITSSTLDNFIPTTANRNAFWDNLVKNLNIPTTPGNMSSLNISTTSGNLSNPDYDSGEWNETTAFANSSTEDPFTILVSEDPVTNEVYVHIDQETGSCYRIVCEEYNDTSTTPLMMTPSSPLPTSTTGSSTLTTTGETMTVTTAAATAKTTTTLPIPLPTATNTPAFNDSTTDFLLENSSSTTEEYFSPTPIPTDTTRSGIAETSPFLVQPMENNPEKWTSRMDLTERKRLRKLCWETMFGQEIIKLTVMDMVVTVVMIVLFDYVRAVFVRILNGHWCWDLEKKFPGYPDFKIAENILHLVNNQGMIWMGMFFSPGLPAVNTLKLIVLLYVRSWAVVTSNVPPEVVFKASNNNNFYLFFLLTMLFLCTLPVGYAVVWLEPSWHCGPFSDYPKIYQLATSTLIGGLPSSVYPIIDYISSPGVVIPAGLLLVLIIYYLLSLTAALREANSDLRDQLRQERSADKRKALEARSGKGRAETPTTRWGRVVPLTPMPRQRLDGISDPEKPPANPKSPPLEPVLPRVSPLNEPPRGKDDGPWPDDVTDLGHSEVFDDSLSEPRKAGKDTPIRERGEKSVEGRKHSKEKGRVSDKETADGEAAHRSSSHGRSRRRHSSHGSKDEDDANATKTPRIKHRSHGGSQGHKPSGVPKERKHSEDSSHRDSPTRARSIHRSSIVDSPALRRKKSSGSHPSKIKEKMPEECLQELNEVLQQKEAKQGKSSKATVKSDQQQKPEPHSSKNHSSQSRHRREPSILKMDDLRRGSQDKAGQPKASTQPGQQPGPQGSSSDDSQGMQTIPVIKISKEDSVERSLQQAKLERQAKATEEDFDTGSDQQSVSTTDPTTPSPIQKRDAVTGRSSIASQPMSPPPMETDLDEPYSPSNLEDPSVTSDKVKLLEKQPKETEEVLKDEDNEAPPDTPTSNEESTLLDNN